MRGMTTSVPPQILFNRHHQAAAEQSHAGALQNGGLRLPDTALGNGARVPSIPDTTSRL